jgi:hypothetical protein
MGSLSEENATVVIYGTYSAAEAAVRGLQRCGFDLRKVSVAARDTRTGDSGDRAARSNRLGAFWAGILGMLSDWDFFAISDIGLVFVAGPLAEWVATGLKHPTLFGGLSGLGAGLYSIGIPKSSVLQYEAALKGDKYLLVAHGTTDEVSHAREILQRAGGASLTAAPR